MYSIAKRFASYEVQAISRNLLARIRPQTHSGIAGRPRNLGSASMTTMGEVCLCFRLIHCESLACSEINGRTTHPVNAKGSLDRAVPAMQNAHRTVSSHAVTNRVEVSNRLRCLRRGPDICLPFSTGRVFHLVKAAHPSALFGREGHSITTESGMRLWCLGLGSLGRVGCSQAPRSTIGGGGSRVGCVDVTSQPSCLAGYPTHRFVSPCGSIARRQAPGCSNVSH